MDTVERAEMVEKQLDAMIERSGSREPDPDEKSALWETGVSPLEAPAQENHGKPADSVHFLGNFGRNNAFGEPVGGKTLGELQALVEALAGLQHGGEPGLTVVGPLEDAEDEDGEVA